MSHTGATGQMPSAEQGTPGEHISSIGRGVARGWDHLFNLADSRSNFLVTKQRKTVSLRSFFGLHLPLLFCEILDN